MSPNENIQVSNILFEYLINDDIGQHYFGKYLSSFILENKCDKNIVDGLNGIKQGALIYSAFQYTPEEYSKNTWDTDLVFYFDTELLFSIYGLNGELFQKIVCELLELIEKINKSSQKRIQKKTIELKYFPEIENEVNSYFKKAEFVVSSPERSIQTKTAMKNIINGCGDVSDVLQKRGLFWGKLRVLGFECEKNNFFDEINNKHNLLSLNGIAATLDNYSDYSQEEIQMNMNILNKINILRKGRNESLNAAKHIFLTATSLCLNIARNSTLMREGAVPLASSCEYFINKLWVKTNRNFASININSIDVVMRAQLVITSIMNITIEKKFKEVQQKYSDGMITREEADAALVAIREFSSENISANETNVERIIDFTENDIDNHIDNYNHQMNQARTIAEQNDKLKKDNDKLVAYNLENNEKLRYYEEKEQNRKKLHEKRIYLTKTIVLLLLSIAFIFGNYFFNIKRLDNKVINIVFNTMGSIGAILGIARFFGIDNKSIGNFIQNKKRKTSVQQTHIDDEGGDVTGNE